MSSVDMVRRWLVIDNNIWHLPLEIMSARSLRLRSAVGVNVELPLLSLLLDGSL